MDQAQRKRIKKVVVIVLLVVVGLIGWQLYRISQFHLIKTDPKLSNVTTVVPELSAYFNDELDASSLKYSDPDKLADSVQVKGKSVTFVFNKNLPLGFRTRITIASIKNKNGERLQNIDMPFAVKKGSYNKLSKEQQSTLVGRQDERIYEVNGITYVNFDKLVDIGVTDQQLINIKNNIYDYSNIIDEKFWEQTIDPASIQAISRDQNSTSTTNTVNFTLTTSGQIFRAHVEYDMLYDTIYMELRKPDGTLVYDSANAGESN